MGCPKRSPGYTAANATQNKFHSKCEQLELLLLVLRVEYQAGRSMVYRDCVLAEADWRV